MIEMEAGAVAVKGANLISCLATSQANHHFYSLLTI